MEEMQEKQEVKEEKRKIKKSAIIIMGLVVAGLIAYFVVDTIKYQSTDDAYVETTTVSVAPKVSGQIVEVLIKDNQFVKEGDLVARIDDTDYKVKVDQITAQYERTLLDQENAKANFKAADANIELAKKDLERYKNLYESGAVSKQKLDEAQTKYDGILAKHLTAQENIMSNSNTKVADADIKALKAIRDQAALNLEYTNVKSLARGTVTKKNLEKGAFVQVGQPLFAIASDEVWVVANFKENQVGKMRAGQVVEIKIDAYPNKVFKGKIDSIQRASGAKASLFPPENAVGSFVKIVQRIPVKIVFDETIDNEVYNIVAGMSVVPKVRIK